MTICEKCGANRFLPYEYHDGLIIDTFTKRSDGIWYRALHKDEWISRHDKVLMEGPELEQTTTCFGKQAPDPAFTSHRAYYRPLPKWMQDALNAQEACAS